MNKKSLSQQINRLAIPALISGIAEPILSLTDAAIVGNIKVNATEALAAVGIVTTFLSMLIWVLGQTRSAISAILSQYLGAKKLDEVKNMPAQAIAIITLLSCIILAITFPFAAPIFKMYNASGLILENCVSYYKIRIFGFPFTLFVIAVFGIFRGLQNTYYPMVIAIIGAVLNIILDYILVYGIPKVLQPMHLEGAAYASVIAQLVMALLATYYLLKKTSIPLRVTVPFNPEIKHFLQMIGNLFIRTIALNITLYFASSYATSYGKQYIAAYTIAINLWFLGAFLIDGYASAGTILSGKFYGAKKYKTLVQLSNKLIYYGGFTGIVIALIGTLFYKTTGNIFTNDAQVIYEFQNIFWLVLLMQPFCAIAFIFDGIFKGLGKMKTLRNLLLVVTLFIFLPILFYLDHLGYKLTAIFIALFVWIIARGIPLIILFRKQFLPQM